MSYKIELHPGVPRDPDKFLEWLREWHRKHNGITTTQADERAPEYQLTQKGRQFAGLSLVGGAN